MDVVEKTKSLVNAEGKPIINMSYGAQADNDKSEVMTCGTLPAKRPAYKAPASYNIGRSRSTDETIEHQREGLAESAKDTVRNYEVAAGSIDNDTNHTVGCDYRMVPVPELQMLGFNNEQILEFVKNDSALWRIDTKSTGNWFDPAGEKNFVQILSDYYRCYRIYGEAFAVFKYLERQNGRNTAVSVVDPARIRTPNNLPEKRKRNVVGGIEKTINNYPKGYFLLNEKRGSMFYTGQEKYKYIQRRTVTGRDQVIHSFIPNFPEQSRGITPFASTLKRIKKLEKYEEATINAAILHATVAATIESDYKDSGYILTQNEQSENVKIPAEDYYMSQCGNYAEQMQFSFDDVIVPRLWNGEKFNLHTPGQPTAQFEVFERAMLKHFARALGQSYEWLAGDWSNTNYSGARAGLLTIWAAIECNRMNIVDKLANAIYACWMEDNIASGRLKIPGIEDPTNAWVYFNDNKDIFTCAEWYGPAQKEIDRAKQMKAFKDIKDLKCLTKRDFCNQVLDQDYREVMRQGIIEEKEERDLRRTILGDDAEFEKNEETEREAIA